MSVKSGLNIEKRENNMKGRFILMIFVIGLTGLSFFWFISMLRKTVYDTQLTNMEELANHDIKTIHNFMEDDWKTLENIASKASLEALDSEEDISAYLRKEQILSEFDDIYLVNESGVLYSTSGTYQANREILNQNYQQSHYVMSREDIMESSLQSHKDVLFSGVSLSGVTIQGQHIISIIGKFDLNKIQDRILITNYNGKGYSSVFDVDGNMIIGINANGQRISNYFDFLNNSTDLSEEEIKEIQGRISHSKNFNITLMEKYSGQTSVVSFQPIEDSDWYFILSVPKSVFDNQNRTMLGMVLIMVLVVLAGIIFLLLTQFRYRLKEQHYKDEALQKEALEDALNMAESANRAKTTFLFNMSHDIRTPLNAIIGFTELQEKFKDDPEKVEDYHKKVKLASKQLLDILNSVLEMARIESDKLEIDEILTDGNEFFQTWTTVFEGEFAKKDQTFVKECRLEHPYLYLDRTHLTVVMMNLVSNAMKYTPNGGRIYASMTELPGDDREHTILKAVVKDTGIGMSPEFIAHIFDEFSRERNSTTSGIQGTGLGMAIVERLIKKMGGTIDIQSVVEAGTTITVKIPVRIGENPNQFDLVSDSAKTEEDMMESVDLEGKRILLAEDVDINAMIANEFLTMNGLVVERAHDGRECIRMVETAESDYYDLILMDIQMPNMNGYEATEYIRNLDDYKKSRLPIIAMTANAFEEDRKKAYLAGMNGHVAKPFEIENLLATMRTVLQMKDYYVDSKEMQEFWKQYRDRGRQCGFIVYRDDKNGSLVFADSIVIDMYGCKDRTEFNEFCSNSFDGLVHPDDVTRVEKEIKAQQRESSKSLDYVDYRFIRKDGRIRNAKDIGFKTYTEHGVFYYVYIVDVTDLENL